MEDSVLLGVLEELANQLSIKVIKDKNLMKKSGFCRYRSQYYLVIKNKQNTKQLIKIYSNAIAQILPEDYYLPPKVREIIELNKKGVSVDGSTKFKE